jgi:deoxyribose-phosphate aldolase
MNFDRNIARLIDHTILKPGATRAEVKQVCAEALQYEFASVCVNSFWIPVVARELRGSVVKVCTVAGFPLGAGSTAAKVAETLGAIADGATEVDMVINIGALLGDEHFVVESDILAVVKASHDNAAIVKVIIETALLDRDLKILACQLARNAGFAKSGATVEDIRLMRATVGPSMGVKASGGIRTLDDLRAMVAAGATRVGASSSVKIIEAASPKDAAPY